MALGSRKKEKIQKIFDCGVLDIQDADVAALSPKGCEIVWLNTHAKARLRAEGLSEYNCKSGYSLLFPDLCKMCSAGEAVTDNNNAAFDTTDRNQCVFSVRTGMADRIEGGPVRIMFLRDVNDERNTSKKLYNLAYTDQLTKIPNRRKFTEDFDAVAEPAENGSVSGLVAIFDLDNFKSVNDTYGHNTGDIMLQKLAERLDRDPAFKGRIYRLGGDEFVLLYIDRADRFASQDLRRKHYEELLNGALVSYTLPNIEVSCTLSMGAAFFPEHGDSCSELLRKADISLYKAKAAGRNRLVFFEDRYDTAKKFKDIFITVSPILSGVGKTFGYELVDRGNDVPAEGGAVSLAGIDRSVDLLGLDDMEGAERYFISYSPQLLDEAALNNLPRDKFVIQFSAAERRGDRELKKLRELRSRGFSVALTDLKATVKDELLSLVDYCKFAAAGAPSDSMKAWIIANNPEKVFIAANINTYAEFEEAKRRGFKLFQGFFFIEPPAVVKKTKEVNPLKANYYRLLKAAGAADYIDFREISSIISSDPALSYKLLRLLNSAAVGLRNVSSIAMAVAYLGEENLKKWVALLALRGLGADKPLELVRLSLIRAQFGSLLAPYFRIKRNPNAVFLLGMLSLLHIALEKTKEELFEEIPVSDDIRESLLTKNGVYSDLIPFFRNYEYANWESVSRFADEHGIDSKLITDSYTAAVKWYNSLDET